MSFEFDNKGDIEFPVKIATPNLNDKEFYINKVDLPKPFRAELWELDAELDISLRPFEDSNTGSHYAEIKMVSTQDFNSTTISPGLYDITEVYDGLENPIKLSYIISDTTNKPKLKFNISPTLPQESSIPLEKYKEDVQFFESNVKPKVEAYFDATILAVEQFVKSYFHSKNITIDEWR